MRYDAYNGWGESTDTVIINISPSSWNDGSPASPSPTATGSQKQGGLSSIFFVYAALAGACGALSGVVGKVAVSPTAVPSIISFFLLLFGSGESSTPLPTLKGGGEGLTSQQEGLTALTTSSSAAPSAAHSFLLLFFRTLFFGSNAFFTAQMWRYYLKSLSLGPTPVCQIVNTGTNFAVSALVGIVFFSEAVDTMWCCGAALVVIGLGMVVLGTDAGSAKRNAQDKGEKLL